VAGEPLLVGMTIRSDGLPTTQTVIIRTMANSSRWVYILLGVVVVATGIGYTALHFMFRDFAGGHCTDTGQQTIASPDKKHTIMSYYRECGGPTFLFVNIAIGNTNSGYEYVPIVQIGNVVPDKPPSGGMGQTNSWSPTRQLRRLRKLMQNPRGVRAPRSPAATAFKPSHV
jgi:hypothetical protein